MDQKARYMRTRNTSNALLLGLVLTTALACANGTLGDREGFEPVPRESGEPSAAVYDTMEEAAIAALARLRSEAGQNYLDRLQVGSIVRIGTGYGWRRPARSNRATLVGSRPRARIAIGRDHVATYIAHPLTGEVVTDRKSEELTRSERRIVDVVDPQHRPVFLLTPSDRIVAYFHGAPIFEVATLSADSVSRGEKANVRMALERHSGVSPASWLRRLVD